jgi:hypothetical protein
MPWCTNSVLRLVDHLPVVELKEHLPTIDLTIDCLILFKIYVIIHIDIYMDAWMDRWSMIWYGARRVESHGTVTPTTSMWHGRSSPFRFYV